MPTLNPKTTAVKAYVLTVIIVGILVSPLPQLALAIALLAIQLYTTYKPPSTEISLAINMGTLVLMPLIMEQLLGSNLAALPMIPAVYLIDQNLRENARHQPIKNTKTTRTPTQTLTVLATALTCVLTASVLLFNKPLIYATSTVMIYLAAILAYSYRKIPPKPLKETKTWRRILVGNTENTHITLSSKTKLPLKVTISATQPWMSIKPENISIIQPDQTQLNVTYTPPLAGPTKLQLHVSAIDPWGLMQINQTIEPVDLHIIPRAKYARWLAKKYLEQTAAGTASTGAAPHRALKSSKQGVEFYGSRIYQPGDRLKDVDWKHTLMHNELIVKEFAGAHGIPTIIVADMTTKDEKDTDKVAYNLVIAALTAATQSLPSGLACFNQKEVIAVNSPMDPRETLKVALKITEKTSITPQPARIIQPPEIQKLKRTLRGLKEAVETEPAEGFKEILGFEYEAIRTATKIHPATVALTKCIQRTSTPAAITVASMGSGDTEALSVALERFREQGYSIVTI